MISLPVLSITSSLAIRPPPLCLLPSGKAARLLNNGLEGRQKVVTRASVRSGGSTGPVPEPAPPQDEGFDFFLPDMEIDNLIDSIIDDGGLTDLDTASQTVDPSLPVQSDTVVSGASAGKSSRTLAERARRINPSHSCLSQLLPMHIHTSTTVARSSTELLIQLINYTFTAGSRSRTQRARGGARPRPAGQMDPLAALKKAEEDLDRARLPSDAELEAAAQQELMQARIKCFLTL